MASLADKSRLPQAVAMQSGEDATSYLLGYDQVGSLKAVAAMDGPDEGRVVKAVDYDAFGNILADSNPSLFLPIAFAGGLRDRLTGLIRFCHRDYDPTVGRFTAPDPLGDTGGDHDLYDYCVDEPVGRVDPEGLEDQGAADSGSFFSGIGDWFGSLGKKIGGMFSPGEAQAADGNGMPSGSLVPEGPASKAMDQGSRTMEFRESDKGKYSTQTLPYHNPNQLGGGAQPKMKLLAANDNAAEPGTGQGNDAGLSGGSAEQQGGLAGDQAKRQAEVDAEIARMYGRSPEELRDPLKQPLPQGPIDTPESTPNRLGYYRYPDEPMFTPPHEGVMQEEKDMTFWSNVPEVALKPEQGIVGTTATKEALKGSTKIEVFGKDGAPSSWMMHKIGKTGEKDGATGWDKWDWMPVPEKEAKSYPLYQEMNDKFYFTSPPKNKGGR